MKRLWFIIICLEIFNACSNINNKNNTYNKYNIIFDSITQLEIDYNVADNSNFQTDSDLLKKTKEKLELKKLYQNDKKVYITWLKDTLPQIIVWEVTEDPFIYFKKYTISEDSTWLTLISKYSCKVNKRHRYDNHILAIVLGIESDSNIVLPEKYLLKFSHEMNYTTSERLGYGDIFYFERFEDVKVITSNKIMEFDCIRGRVELTKTWERK